ncbi:MAG TPA: peptidylprolyl isomerase [Chitinophagaceae bacterium]|nr:peptidylprolyl isomerase [Chitinophagaceae bacterium]
MKNYFSRILIIQTLLLAFAVNLNAQTENLDKVIAIVGDKIILKSEIEMAFEDYKRENPETPESLKCELLENAMGQKIVTEQADRDSVFVTDEEVEAQLDNRIRSFVSQYGSEEKLAEVSGRTTYQLKDDYRPMFKENLQFQKMQGEIMASVKITPQEVRAFYEKIPKDSLPFYPSTVEVGQIVFRPDVNKEVEDYAIERLENIRKDITSGKSAFDLMAGIYSEDPGSRDNGGDLGVMGRDELVPEFAAAAFKLQNGEISPVVKTSFGYHIVQMVNRQGEKAKLRHILIKPLITEDMSKLALKKADSVRAGLVSGKLVFSAAVGKYSNDDASKMTGGMITNQQTGATSLLTEDLEPSVALIINEMKVGEYSQPVEYTDSRTGDKLVRIVYLKSRTEPHKANLQDDYNKIQQVAFAEKQNTYLMTWLEDHISSFYIMIDEEYANCTNIDKWLKASAKAKKN